MWGWEDVGVGGLKAGWLWLGYLNYARSCLLKLPLCAKAHPKLGSRLYFPEKNNHLLARRIDIRYLSQNPSPQGIHAHLCHLSIGIPS